MNELFYQQKLKWEIQLLLFTVLFNLKYTLFQFASEQSVLINWVIVSHLKKPEAKKEKEF